MPQDGEICIQRQPHTGEDDVMRSRGKGQRKIEDRSDAGISQGMPGATRSLERQGRILLQVSEGEWPWQYLDLRPQNSETTNCCFKPPSLWYQYFVMAALGN